MTIDFAHFTPMTSLAGGLMIGAAASILLLFNGRIAGISGIVGHQLRARAGEAPWRLAFVGLVAAPLVYQLARGLPDARVDASLPVLVVAGLLVGYGTRVGSGCTSGHGVCGLSRLSPRSMVATGLFMAVAVATVFVLRHSLARGAA